MPSMMGEDQSIIYLETDPLVDGITVPTEEHLEKLRRFVDDWIRTLRDMSGEVEGATTGPWTWTIGDRGMDPLRLVPVSHDAVRAHHLVSVENPAFASVAKVFAYLASKIASMKQEAQKEFFPMLLMFGERVGSSDMAPEGEVQVLLAKAMPKLQLLIAFMDHLRQLAHNILHQLAALYSERHRVYVTFHHVHMHMAFKALGDVLTMLITIDELMKQNPSFRGSFGPFKRMLLTVRKEPDRFGVDEIEATQLEHTIMQLEGSLLPPRAFEGFLEEEELQVDLATPRFLEEMQTSCEGIMAEVMARIGTNMERPDDRQSMMGVCSLFILRATLGGQVAPVDRKLMKMFLELHKKVPLVPLYINTTVQPTEFLMDWLPESAMALVPGGRDRVTTCERERQEYLDRLETTLEKDVGQLISQATAWIARIESCLPPKVSLYTILGMRLKLVVQGLYLAQRLNTAISTILHLHVSLQQPISKADVRSLAQCMELLKAIQEQYLRRSSMLAASATHLLFFAQCRLHKMLVPVRDQLNADLTTLRSSKSALKSFFSTPKDSEEVKLDALAAATLAMDALGGPATANRRILLLLAVDVLRDTQRLQHDTLHDIEEMVHLMELTVDLMPLTDQLCDCSFLYFSRELIQACIADSVAQPDEAHKLPYLIAAFRDAEGLMQAGDVPADVQQAYQVELEGLVDNRLMKPLCTAIENDLRLHIHSARLTGVVTVNPIKTGVRDMARFLQTKPLRLASKTVNIKIRVEDYLNATFHNHTALALHNWKTYGEMRKLAQEKYGVQLAEITLPGQTLEQGLDVLEIMRNIHLFVSRYQYNLHSQVFVERPHLAAGRHLNTIGIRHVANSIRTHGMGIMNTAVNFAYQFLAKKINVFSQFLYDDHIRSRLLQEMRWFQENRNSCGNEFPLERAEKFNKGIRILGVNKDGATFLDQFRQLIAELGNALGFVRMLRLGGMHYCQNATKFVPNLGHVGETSLEEAAIKEGLCKGTVEAAKNLDVVLSSLRENSAEGVDYFQVLADVFSNELCNTNNEHLQEFYMIMPAMFLSHVEALMMSKDKLMKRGSVTAASFTDDGLILGVSYLLQVLNQGRQMDALHLFESAHKYYEEKIAQAAALAEDPMRAGGMLGDDLEEDDGLLGTKGGDPARGSWRQRNAARAAATATEEELANQKLRIQRFKNFQSEWLLLKFSFSGARVLFASR